MRKINRATINYWSPIPTTTSGLIPLRGPACLWILTLFLSLFHLQANANPDFLEKTESLTSLQFACNITAAGDSTSCVGNATSNPNDDQFTVFLDPMGSGLGATYSVSGDITASNISYGSPQQIGGSYLISDGDLLITITDDTDGSCPQDFIISAPEPCSPCPAPLLLCSGDTIIAKIDTSYTNIQWYYDEGSGPIAISGPIGTDTILHIDTIGTYTYTAIDTMGCAVDIFCPIVVEADTILPTLTCPGNLSAILSATEHPAYSSYAAFISAGGIATDNYGIDTSSFNLTSETSDGNTCPEVVTRTYEIVDSCGNVAYCTQDIIVDSTPATNSANLNTCDNSNGGGFGQFFLHDANGAVTNASGANISYHSTLAEADSGSNDLTSPHNINNVTVYVRVENATSGCYQTNTVSLTVGAKCPENCNNNLDEDGDGLIDCEDSDCPCCETRALILNSINKKE